VTEFVIWQATHTQMARVVQYNLGALDPDGYAEVEAVRQATELQFAAQSKRQRVAGGRSTAEAEAVTRAIVSMGIDLARWYKPGSRKTPTTLGRRCAVYAFRMIGLPDPALQAR
jgi:Tetracyclin repressor-like, C-terminal domain